MKKFKTIKIETDILFFDDVEKPFEFEKLFNMILKKINYEKLFKK